MSSEATTIAETPALESLAQALRHLAEGGSADEALRAIAEGAAAGASAEVAVVRVLDAGPGVLEAGAVAAASTALTAELLGSRRLASSRAAPPMAAQLGLPVSLELPIALGDRELGVL